MKADSIGQLIMTGVPGKELDAETARLFRRVQPGAYILFGRNLESATQLRKLIDDLPLFAATRATSPPQADAGLAALVDALAALRPDEMSPRDALEALYALKTQIAAAKKP